MAHIKAEQYAAWFDLDKNLEDLRNVDQTSAEWHAARRFRLTASNVPQALGKSPFGTPSELVAQKSSTTAIAPFSARRVFRCARTTTSQRALHVCMALRAAYFDTQHLAVAIKSLEVVGMAAP